MSDLIRREDAIEAAYQLRHRPNDAEWAEWLKAFNAVPSADRPNEVIAQITFDEEKLREIVKEAVERFKEEYEITDRPQGEWLNYKDEHTCSVCKEVVIADWYYEYEWYDFCPHCGARMKGADDD